MIENWYQMGDKGIHKFNFNGYSNNGLGLITVFTLPKMN